MTAGRSALRDGWPLLVSSVVIGIPFGIAARQAGLTPIEASAMSLIVFAGAAQFAMLDLFARGADALVIAATVLLINLRHVLMAAALRPLVDGVPLATRLLSAYVLTDESFAMGIARLRSGRSDRRSSEVEGEARGRSARRGRAALTTYYLTFALALWLAWNTATVAGAIVGGALADPRRFGLDFAITAAFIAIVVLGIRGRTDVAVALAAAAIAGALRLAGASAVAVVIAGAGAPLLAIALRRAR